MSSALAVRDEQNEWSHQQVAALRQMGVPENVQHADLMLFLSYAQRTGLDPFARQLYLINYGGKWSTQVSIDGLRIIAQRSKEYEGQTAPEFFNGAAWVDVWTEKAPPQAARVGVLRRNFRLPLVSVAMWNEYGATAKGPVWREKPSLMLAKCAEALALRKAFPNDMSGLYIAEEMPPHGVVPITVDEVRLSVIVAQNEDELRECWRKANAARILQEDVDSPWVQGQVMTLHDLINEARQRLFNPVDVFADDVPDADLVETLL